MRRSSRWSCLRGCVSILLSAVVITVGLPEDSSAQFGGGNQGGNAGGGNIGGGVGGGFGGGAGGGNQAGGILIDADGVVRSLPSQKLSAKLRQERRDAFIAEHLVGDVATFSERRCVSLVRLEQTCQQALQRGEPIDEDVRYLAGLQQIDYLFVDPERADLILAGPAEGFAPDATGRMVGLTTGRPPLRIDDLIIALQATAAGSSSLGCSIDPEPERLARMQQFVKQNSSATSPAGAARRYKRMGQILGHQNVTLFGVPADSHFALTLVEADFRMKRISLGVEPSGVRGLRSHLSLLKPNGNSIQRWWFTALYDGLYATEDHTAFHLAGQRVQLLAQDEISNVSGQRSDAALTRASTQQFAKMFTEHFPELAARSPLFAELQNLFDLAVIAALLQQERLPQQIGWGMSLFSQPDTELVPRYSVPQQVESMSTFRKARRGLVLGLVGGVTIEPRRLLQSINATDEPALRLDGQRRAAINDTPAEPGNWWWD